MNLKAIVIYTVMFQKQIFASFLQFYAIHHLMPAKAKSWFRVMLAER